MVRFIIGRKKYLKPTALLIYIPIWLDLLYYTQCTVLEPEPDLHSNMVRFIIGYVPSGNENYYKFTFQYG